MCGVPVTRALYAIASGPAPLFDERGARYQPGLRGATLERGTSWCSDGSLEWGQAGDLVSSPEDLCGLVPIGKWIGCCGPTGMDGKNLACAAGHPLATRVGDCWTPSCVIFSPRDVLSEAAPAEAAVLPGPVVSLGGEEPLTDPRALWARLHERLGCSAWYGAEVTLLLEDRVTAADEPLVLLWRGAEVSRQAGLPVEAVLDAFVAARRIHGARVMLILA